MSNSAFTTVRRARTASEADLMISVLRSAGLHPVELSLSPHFGLAGAEVDFPIQVPSEEHAAAKEILDSWQTSAGAT
jgi:hypothetical protein